MIYRGSVIPGRFIDTYKCMEMCAKSWNIFRFFFSCAMRYVRVYTDSWTFYISGHISIFYPGWNWIPTPFIMALNFMINIFRIYCLISGKRNIARIKYSYVISGRHWQSQMRWVYFYIIYRRFFLENAIFLSNIQRYSGNKWRTYIKLGPKRLI